MKFNPTPDDASQEERTFEPFPAGEYEYTVDEADDTTSKAGNDMIHATLHIFNEAGHKRIIHEYFVDSAAWKLRQFCASCGLLPKFETGELEAYELVGKTGRAKIVIEKNAEYGDRNKVASYVKAATAPAPMRKAGGGSSIDEDSIPFAPCWQ